MNRPVITAVTAWVPDAIPLSRWAAIESAQRIIGHPGWDAWIRSWHPDYGHWLEAWPGEETGGSLPLQSGLSPLDSTCAVPVETSTDLSGLAVKVANAICTTRPPDAHPIDAIVFCHSSLDEQVSTTIAGRLCAQVGTPCFPFSVSQQHGVSPFTALRLASDLFIAEPDIHTILIVAAEKWCPPFSRMSEPGIVQGDAAGALLVERTDHGPGWLQLLDAATRHVPAYSGRRAAASPDARTFTLLSMIGFFLARHGLRPGDIDDVVGHPGVPLLSGAVSRFLGRPEAAVQHQVCVHLGAAQSLVQLARVPGNADRHRKRRVLLWGFGTSGFVGAALLEIRGAPILCQQDDVHLVS